MTRRRIRLRPERRTEPDLRRLAAAVLAMANDEPQTSVPNQKTQTTVRSASTVAGKEAA